MSLTWFPEPSILAGYGLLGLCAGVLAGLLGVGGGLIIVPALIYLFLWQGLPADQVVHLAVGTSLATIIATASASLRAHHRRGAVQWRLVRGLAPGLVVGGWFGAWLAEGMNTLWLQRSFAVFALAVAAQMVLGRQPSTHRQPPGTVGLVTAGGVIGTVSGVVGIGGGSLSVPFLSWWGVSIRYAVATSAACGLPIAVGGTLGFLLLGPAAGDTASLGHVHWPAALAVAAVSVISAPWGAALAHRLPVILLKRVFALLLAAVGLRLLLG
jgi:uncharacterized membrane protein YfcA